MTLSGAALATIPIAQPGIFVSLLVGSASAITLGGWLRRGGAPSAGAYLLFSLASSLAMARIVFVSEEIDEYSIAPWSIVDIRDGGFALWPGLGFFGACVLWHFCRHPQLRQPLRRSILGGLLVSALTLLLVRQIPGLGFAPVANIALPNVAGELVPLKGVHGRPLVVNLWAAWSSPGRQAMRDMAEAQWQRSDIRFVFADEGDPPMDRETFLQTQAWPLKNVLIDRDMTLSRCFDIHAYPATLFISAKGQLLDIREGELSSEALADELQHLGRSFDADVSR